MDLRPAKPPVYGPRHYLHGTSVTIGSACAVPIGAVEDVLRCAKVPLVLVEVALSALGKTCKVRCTT